MARVTLTTIAEATGLSKYAVSRALSGKSGVSDSTRDKVIEAAERLGYVKPAPTRATRLGVLFDDTDLANSELYMQIQSGAQREAEKLGYDIKVHWTHDRNDPEREASKSAGLLVVGPHDAQALARAYATGTHIVRVGWLDPLAPYDLIGGTDHEAGSAVARYLIGRGHRCIAYVHGDASYRGRMERLYGLREEVEQNPGTRLHDLTWGSDGSFATCFNRLRATGETPTAWFCAHDGLALTVVSELLSRGIRIPQDASVIGFGDFSAARQITPPLTTIKVAGHDFGAVAVRLLDARIRSRSFPETPMRVLIPNTLIERGSVADA